MSDVDYSRASSAQHTRPPKVPEAHRLRVAAIDVFAETAIRAMEHLDNRLPGDTQFKRMARAAMAAWAEHFAEYNQVHFDAATDKRFARSDTDYGFIAVCLAMCVEHRIHMGEQMDPRSMITIVQCHVLQTVLSSNHDMQVRCQWPDTKDVNEVIRLIVQVVNTHFRSIHDMPSLVGLLEMSDCVAFMEAGKTAPDSALFTSLRRQMMAYQACHMPPGLARQLQSARDAAKARKESIKQKSNMRMLDDEESAAYLAQQEKEEEEDDAVKEESEESMGYMWRNTSEELVAQFIPKMSRFVWKVFSDRKLLQKYPAPAEHQEAVQFEESTHERVRAFLADTCATEQDDITLAAFRCFTAEFCLPIGWETHHTRAGQAPATQDFTASADILGDILGVRVTGYVRESTSELMLDIVHRSSRVSCVEEESVHYQPVFLTQIDAFFKRRQRFTWSETYYCVLPHSKEWRAFFDAQQFRGESHISPRVVKNIQKQFYVYYRRALIPCGFSIIPAILMWLFICHRDFAETRGDDDHLYIPLDNDCDAAALYTLLQPRLLTNQPASVAATRPPVDVNV